MYDVAPCPAMMLDSAVAEVIGDAPVELPDGDTVLTGELVVGFAMLNNGWLPAVVAVADESFVPRLDFAQRSPHALHRVFGPCGPCEKEYVMI